MKIEGMGPLKNESEEKRHEDKENMMVENIGIVDAFENIDQLHGKELAFPLPIVSGCLDERRINIFGTNFF